MTRLFRSARRTSGDVDQRDRQAALAESIGTDLVVAEDGHPLGANVRPTIGERDAVLLCVVCVGPSCGAHEEGVLDLT